MTLRPLGRLGHPAMSLLALGVAGYALYSYLLAPSWPRLDPSMRATFDAHRTALLLHVAASSVALLAGPLQFLDRLRRHARLHRLLGKVYLAAVGTGGASALVLAQSAFGGLVSTLGFGTLAVLWLVSALLALRAVRQRRFDAHRRWMIRNYALTFAAVTLRLYLPLGFMAGLPFSASYPVIAWLCWVPNLLAAEALCRSLPAARA